jgi:putative tryptophan/tyrosine transport system substrate-binding protein
MTIGTGRRKFVGLLGSAVAWPFAARAQQSALPVIGWLSSGPALDPHFAGLLTDFMAGLKDAGYVEDRNVEIDFRWSEGQYARLPAVAAELKRRKFTELTFSPISFRTNKAFDIIRSFEE